MKKSSVPFPFSLLIILLQLSLPIPKSGGGGLIERTCEKTPYRDLCVSSLASNPNSTSADVRGLAGIAMDFALLNATGTLNFTRSLIKRTTDPVAERPLDYCAELYIPVVNYTLPQGKEAFDKGQYKFAGYSLSDAAKQADACEKRFSGRDVKPLGDRNEIFQKLCGVAIAIISVLLKDC